jgi:PAS domain S-box-containing protein
MAISHSKFHSEEDEHSILVADDEVIIATELEDKLTAMGYRVVALATNGKEAVELAGSLRPELILMDVLMPGKLDGIEAARIIKEKWDIPTLFLSAFAGDNLIKRAKQVCPAGYVLKPFQDTQISAAIEIALHRCQSNKRTKISEARYRAVVEDQTELICRFDSNWKITFVNDAFCHYYKSCPRKLLAAPFIKCAERAVRKRLKKAIVSLDVSNPIITLEYPIYSNQNQIHWIQWSIRAIFLPSGQLVEYQSVGRDISKRVEMEEELKRAALELEQRVELRTKELEIKTAALEELNTALKILLKKRHEDKISFENRMLTNMGDLVIPFLEKAKKSTDDKRTNTYLKIIESNLNDIISPFARTIPLKYARLTPTEVKVAHLIKQGRTTKEIAELLSVSARTVESYRNSIRKKMGIKNTKVNLRLFLQPSDYI